jgi:hypothetical protein
MAGKPLKPTVAQAVRLNALRGGWSSYKHALIRAGIIANSDCDVPLEWKNAFLRANKRPPVLR